MSDELDIRAKVTLEADEAESIKQIKGQIPAIENGLKTTRVKVQLDADAAKASQDINDAIKQATGSLKTGGKAVIPIDIETRIKEGENGKLRRLLLDIQNLQIKLSKSNVQLDFTKLNNSLAAGSITQAREELTILGKQLRNLNSELSAKLPNQAIENLPKSINDASTSVSILTDKFKGLKSQGMQIPTDSLTRLTELSGKLKSLSSMPMDGNTLSQFRGITSEIDKLTNQYKEAASTFTTYKLDIGAQNVKTDIDRIRNNLLTMKNDWSAMTHNQALMTTWKKLFSTINSGTITSRAEVTALSKDVGDLSSAVKAAGLAHKNWWGQLTQNLQKFTSWFLIGGGVASAVRGLRDMVTAVKDVDAVMVELKKTTDLTSTAYDNFLSRASKKAVELGSTLTNYIKSVSDFSKMGYDLQTSENLSEVANIYLNVADNMSSIEDANSTIISTLKATNSSADDAISIIDKINEVANKYAVDSADLGTGLKNSISALSLAGNDLDQVLAMLTAITQVTQDASESGNSLKVLSMRIRGMKGELQDLGEEYENVQAVSKIQTQLLNLTGVNIMDSVDPTKFKSTYQIMLEISKVYKSLAETDQANVLEILAGKHRGNSIAALLTQMSEAENVLTDSINSQGSATREYQKWLSSVEAKQQQAKAQFEAFSNAILDSELIKGFYGAETGILGFLTTLIEKLGTIPTVATAAVAALSFKNVG